MLCCFWASWGSAEQATIAVASNFAATAKTLAADFSAREPHSLRLVQGSSGRLFAQIHQGAPFDVLLSADRLKPKKLMDQHLAVTGSRFTYALGELLLWSADAGFFSEQSAPIETQLSIEARLKSDAVSKISLANPRLAPYGAAAVEVMRGLKLEQSLRAKWVTGENIAQAFQFAASGNATLGFIAASQLQLLDEDKRGSHWPVPQTLHRPIAQDAVLLKRARDNIAAQRFMRYLASPPAQMIIRSQGYQTPKQEAREDQTTRHDD